MSLVERISYRIGQLRQLGLLWRRKDVALLQEALGEIQDLRSRLDKARLDEQFARNRLHDCWRRSWPNCQEPAE